MKIERNKSLRKYTTYKIGGKADFFIEAKNTSELKKAIKFAKNKKIHFVIIGNGSNILINDKGVRGVVIKIINTKINVKNDLIICEAGVYLSKILNEALEHNLSGVEFLAGIPGTLGGAIAGNAGTKNKNISDTIKSVKILKNDGEVIEVKKNYFDFGYRESAIKRKKDIILKAIIKLKKTNKKTIQNKISQYLEKRKKQPHGYSAGSIFKNPKKYSAGELIEKAGLKGQKRGEAQISKKHANFIINLGNASASDIKYLIKLAQKKVMNKFGVQLQKEIRYLDQRGWK